MNIADKIMEQIREKLPPKNRLLEIEHQIKQLKTEKKLILKGVDKIGLTDLQLKILGEKPEVPRLSFSKKGEREDTDQIKKYNNYMMMKTYYTNRNKLKSVLENMESI